MAGRLREGSTGNNVNTASLVNLKAELARKQVEYKREKNDPALRDERLQGRKSKRAAAWLKQNKGVLERHRRDVLQAEQDGQSLAQVDARLKAKAALYERLRQGDMTPEEQEKYLVDFEEKFLDRIYSETEADRDQRENGPYDKDREEQVEDGEEWVDYVDSFGRRRRCMKKDVAALKEMDAEDQPSSAPTDLVSEDMQREQQRQKWEQQMEEERNQPRGPIHYETVRAGEIRNLGTGYFAFSTDEIERGQQRQLLEQLRDETHRGRSKRARLKERREKMMQARLAKIKQRQGGEPAHKAAKAEASGDGTQATQEEGREPGGRSEAQGQPLQLGGEEERQKAVEKEEEETIDDVLDALMPSDD